MAQLFDDKSSEILEILEKNKKRTKSEISQISDKLQAEIENPSQIVSKLIEMGILTQEDKERLDSKGGIR